MVMGDRRQKRTAKWMDIYMKEGSGGRRRVKYGDRADKAGWRQENNKEGEKK